VKHGGGEVAGIFIQRDAIGTKMVSELRQEDIDRWRARVDEKQTKANEPLSTRRKNMAWDVLNQILKFARGPIILRRSLIIDGGERVAQGTSNSFRQMLTI
jgi:hypothetical protein